MSEADDPISDLDRLRNLPIRSEEIGFAPDAMIACEKCTRPNAPNRAVCIYCGTALPGSVAEATLELRELENWESGFNVVVSGVDADAGPAAAMLAKMINAEINGVRGIIESDKALPVARVESESHAEAIIERLRGHGVEARIVSDESLLPRQTPTRLRAIEFTDDELVLNLFGKAETERLQRDDFALIVPGVLFEARTDAIEKRKRQKTTTMSEIQTSSDEPVIDIYSRHDPTGWRIPANGFDFSCLGAQKSLLVADNMETLVAKLESFGPTVKVVDDYASVRAMLEQSWPAESRRDSLGMQRSGFNRKDLASVSTTTNQIQFTRYSRLQWHLL